MQIRLDGNCMLVSNLLFTDPLIIACCFSATKKIFIPIYPYRQIVKNVIKNQKFNFPVKLCVM